MIPQFVEDTQMGSSTLSAQCKIGIENLDRAQKSYSLNEDAINICALKTRTGFY